MIIYALENKKVVIFFESEDDAREYRILACPTASDYLDIVSICVIPSSKATADPLTEAAPDLLEACRAFVEAWEKSLQLEKTAMALTMAKIAIEKATK